MTEHHERWVPVPGFEGQYQVSDVGRVRSVDRVDLGRDGKLRHFRSKILTPAARRIDGRQHVTFGAGSGIIKSYMVHRLVLEAFVGPRPPGMECCHNNGDASDNRLSNLRWDTRDANIQDKIKHAKRVPRGRRPRLRGGRLRGATRCLRGHLLEAPNLVEYKLKQGARECLACKRTHTRHWVAKKHEIHFDFQRMADLEYAQIMEGHDGTEQFIHCDPAS